MSLSGLAGCSRHDRTAVKPAPDSSVSNAFSAVAGSNDVAVLKLKWPAGKKYFMRMEMIQSWDTSSAGKAATAEPTISITFDYSITPRRELPGGGQEVDLDFVAEKLVYQIGEMTLVNFDSAQSPDRDNSDPVSPALRKMLGASLRCTTDGTGKTSKIDGFNELRTRLDGVDPQVRAMLGTFFNERNFKDVYNFAAALPAPDPVSAGDNWPARLERTDDIGRVIISLKCNSQGREYHDDHACIRVEYHGDIAAEPAVAGAAKLTSGAILGKAWFDPEMGTLVNLTVEQHMTVETTGNDRGNDGKWRCPGNQI